MYTTTCIYNYYRNDMLYVVILKTDFLSLLNL